ncbi:MAG: hypothetical protein K8W52_14445 [Deltaproteobacteria bacterium]|nr:hypothetical protein [Deltaproteobacteria bacterium]
MRTRLEICLALMIVGACGGGSGSPDASVAGSDAVMVDSLPPDATPVVTIDTACAAYQALIDKLIACNPEFDLLVTQGRATPATITAFCHGSTSDFLGDGTVALPSYAEIQACLDYAATTSCTDVIFETPVCDLLHGTVANAGMCDITDQCDDASYCAHPGAGCGACTARKADGMTCANDEECANGTCVGTQCGHRGLDNDPCVVDDDCVGQRVCNASNKCETKVWALNDTCSGLGDCGILHSDLYCKPTNGVSGAGQCAHFTALGATCNPAQPFAALCDLRSYEWCNPQATGGPKCSPANVVQDGQDCSAFQGDRCAAGLVCSDPLGQNPGACYVPGALGATCGGASDPPCDLFMGCVAGKCAYDAYTGACPAP